jgi:glycosyltransferase involved in cell wall biosynthesis
MRIVYLNPIGELGGAERSLLDIFAALKALEPSWELHLIAGADGPLLSEAIRLGVSAETLAMPEELLVLGDSAIGSERSPRKSGTLHLLRRGARAALGARRYAEIVRARLDELKPDLIHSNGIKFHLLTRLLRRLEAPVLWHIRDFIGARKLVRHALRWAAPAAAVALTNSEAVAAETRSILPTLPVRTVLNCIDTVRFSPGPGRGAWLDELAQMPAAAEGTLRVGLLASYARWKGQDLFLKAAEKVRAAAPEIPVRFYIVGGPIYKTQGSQFSIEELQTLIRRSGLSNCAGLVPFQYEPEDVYRALDIVIHASTQPEPFGRTIAEAMACGRAVIASLAGGVEELFNRDIEVLGAPPNDAAELAWRMEMLLKNPLLRQQLESAARRSAVERFSRERVGNQLRAIYGTLLQSQSPKKSP